VPVPPPTLEGRSVSPRPSSAAPLEARAYLDQGSKVTGKISFEGPARIDGQVDGEITAKDSVTIGENAVVTAQIKAASIVVAGKISGDLTASQRIEIRPSAKVLGNLTAPVLVVHEGAVFEGHCAMQPESAREDRKVTVFLKEERMVVQAGGQKQA
jgi:cytoskeletal protein CcmA (bactofilin family)